MRKTNQITLNDVAEKAGVSCSAAGKVLNGGSDKIRVGAKTREKILAVAKELNYQPNMAASILAGGNSRLIGVLLDSGISYRYLSLLREIETVASEYNYRLLTSFTHDSVENMMENYHDLRHYGVAGVICLSHDYPEFHQEIADAFRNEKKIVFMEKPAFLDQPYVATSRKKALTDMIAQAVKDGYKRFGMVCSSPIWATEQALCDDFKEALLANHLPVDKDLIHEYKYSEEKEYSLQKRTDDTVKNFICRKHPDFLYVDDAHHGANIALRIAKMENAPKLFGGNNDPLFAGLGIGSLDPCYEKIARALLAALNIPKKSTAVNPVVDSVYKKRSLNG